MYGQYNSLNSKLNDDERIQKMALASKYKASAVNTGCAGGFCNVNFDLGKLLNKTFFGL